MKSRLFEPHADTNFNFYSWPFSSVHHWGENSLGTWTVNFADKQAGNTGRVISAKLELIGTPVNPLSVAEAGLHEKDDQANGNGALDLRGVERIEGRGGALSARRAAAQEDEGCGGEMTNHDRFLG